MILKLIIGAALLCVPVAIAWFAITAARNNKG